MDQTWQRALGASAPVLQSEQVFEGASALSDYIYDEGDQVAEPESGQGLEAGDSNSQIVYQGIIQDEAGYNSKRDERRDKEQRDLLRKGAQSDCPQDPAEQRVWVGRLFDAIKNIENVIDKPCKNGALAQSAQRIKDNYYSDEIIEIACWNTFLECRRAALGVRMVDPHHQTRREHKNAYPTFAARMNMIIQVCTTSKATCKQILDPSFVHRLVDAPAKALKMKQSNLRINGQRNIQNKIGRDLIKKEGIQHPDLLPVKASSKAKRIYVRRARKPAEPHDSNQRPTSLTPGLDEPKTHSNKRPIADGGEHYSSSADDYSPPKRRASRKKTTLNTPNKTTRGRSKGKYTGKARVSRPKPAESSPTFAMLLDAPASPQHAPEETLEALEALYRKLICEILKVDESFADQLGLSDLRLYACGYNDDLFNQQWNGTPYVSNAIFEGPFSTPESTNGISQHIAFLAPWLIPLAIARGDVTAGDPPIVNSIKGFKTHEDPIKNAALGLIENPLGYCTAINPHMLNAQPHYAL